MGHCSHRRASHRPGSSTRTTVHPHMLCNHVIPTSPTIRIWHRHAWFLNSLPCKRLPQRLELGWHLAPDTDCILYRSGPRRIHRIQDGLCRPQRSLRLVVPERSDSTVTSRRPKPDFTASNRSSCCHRQSPHSLTLEAAPAFRSGRPSSSRRSRSCRSCNLPRCCARPSDWAQEAMEQQFRIPLPHAADVSPAVAGDAFASALKIAAPRQKRRPFSVAT